LWLRIFDSPSYLMAVPPYLMVPIIVEARDDVNTKLYEREVLSRRQYVCEN
jgi:hypothetical protein